MNPLLENAVVSIRLGLEDFASDDERRIISAARNLYSGVLLLAKEVLRQLSPPGSNDILIRIKKRAVKQADGSVMLVGDGKKTIDRFEIEETFKQLQLAVDLSNLKRLADIRNDIEHMHPQHAPALIQEAIADAMPIIRDIIVKELHQDPVALLEAAAWGTLLDQAKVFKAEKIACQKSFKEIKWQSNILAEAVTAFQCPNCSSSLLRNDNEDAKVPADLHLVCSKCGKATEVDKVIEAALGESLWFEINGPITDGADPVLERCPECYKQTYVFKEAKCLNPRCGFSLKGRQCSACNSPLTIDDYIKGDGSLCANHSHMWRHAHW
jgi:hypothetical protein